MDCYKGNPFIDCMPPALDKNAFFLKIAEKPDLHYTESLVDNLAYVNQIRNSFFVPLTFHYILYLKIYNLFREVYRIRTPIWWIKKLNEIKEWSQNPMTLPPNIDLPPFVRKLMLGFSVLGVPGMGKTRSLEKVFSLFEQVIMHRAMGIKQVSHLTIECTIKGSTKQICRSFFDELDHVVDEKYLEKYDRDSEEKLMIQMANKIILHQIGVLKIEEVHNICTSSRGTRETVINFFKTLSNRIGIPIIYVGTKDAAPVLHGNYQTASRTQGIGMEPLIPFSENDPEWKFFLDKLWDCQIFPNPGELRDDIRKVYFEKSQGILREVIQVHCNAQEIALLNDCKSLAADHIRSTSSGLQATSIAIAGYRNKTRSVMKHFNDLQMTTPFMLNEEKGEKSCGSRMKQESAALFDFAKKEWPKISYAQIDEAINGVLKSYADLPIEKKFQKLREGISNLDRQNKLEPKPKLGPPKGELIEMCINAKTSLDYYSILSQHGIISELGDVVPI